MFTHTHICIAYIYICNTPTIFEKHQYQKWRYVQGGIVSKWLYCFSFWGVVFVGMWWDEAYNIGSMSFGRPLGHAGETISWAVKGLFAWEFGAYLSHKFHLDLVVMVKYNRNYCFSHNHGWLWTMPGIERYKLYTPMETSQFSLKHVREDTGSIPRAPPLFLQVNSPKRKPFPIKTRVI